jgi:hypothetical protein
MNNEVVEIKSLRIGNLLTYKEDLVHVTSLSLDIDDEYEDTIGFCKYGQVSNEHAEWNRALYPNLCPIPLTPEWLERFEFRESTNIFAPGVFELAVHGHEIHYDASVYTYTYFDCQLRDVLYVHQLQNLYFTLTGYELEIKTPAITK